MPPSIELPRERSQCARERELVVVEAGALPAEPLRARDPHHELVAALVQLGAVDLEDRALGPGPVARLRGVAAALHGEVERALVHLELRDLVAQHARRRARRSLAEAVLARELHEPAAAALFFLAPRADAPNASAIIARS